MAAGSVRMSREKERQGRMKTEPVVEPAAAEAKTAARLKKLETEGEAVAEAAEAAEGEEPRKPWGQQPRPGLPQPLQGARSRLCRGRWVGCRWPFPR